MKEFKVEHIVETISEVERIIAKQKNDAAWAGRMDGNQYKEFQFKKYIVSD
jgi:hypothetical protein